MHERERSSPAACSIIVPVGAKSMIFGRDVDNNVPKNTWYGATWKKLCDLAQ